MRRPTVRVVAPCRALRLAGALFGAAVSALAGCGDHSEWSAETEHQLGSTGGIVTQASSGALPPFFDRVVRAPETTAFRGTRRVVLHRGGEVFDYTEVVGADGTGRFAVEVPSVQAAPPTLDPAIAPLLLEQRARFGYRVRDPHITDLATFAANWRVTVASRDTLVAGHACWTLEIERAVPLASVDVSYELDVEPRTGFVLAWRERDTAGQLHADVAFQSFEFDADVSGMDLRERDLVAVDLDPLVDYSAQVGATVRMPNLAPPGFVLEEVEHLTLPSGDEWVKFVFTDGLERAFFLHRVERGTTPPALAPSRVDHAPFGSWTLAVGEVAGVEVMAAAKVPAQFLAELIQSAIR